jgi:hypothetical protein
VLNCLVGNNEFFYQNGGSPVVGIVVPSIAIHRGLRFHNDSSKVECSRTETLRVSTTSEMKEANTID